MRKRVIQKVECHKINKPKFKNLNLKINNKCICYVEGVKIVFEIMYLPHLKERKMYSELKAYHTIWMKYKVM